MAIEDVHRYLKARRKAYSDNNLTEAASFCNLIGVYYSEKGDHEKALQYHREELQLSESLRDKLGQAVAHRKIGEALGDLCQFSAALNEQDQYLKIANSLSNLQEIQRAHATIGRIWYMKYKADDTIADKSTLKNAKSSYTSSLKVVDEMESLGGVVTMKELSDMRARIYLNLGLLAEETNELLVAEGHYKKACQIGKEFNIQEGLLWQCHFNLGELLTALSQGNRALVVLEESLSYTSKNPQNKAMSLLQMAMISVEMFSWAMAKKFLKMCIKLSSSSDSEQFQSTVQKYKAVSKIIRLQEKVDTCSSHCDKIQWLERMGDICSHKTISFYTAAIKFYSQELELAETHGLEPKKVSEVLFSLAETHSDKEEFDKALEYYKKELLIWTDHPNEAASSWCNIARVHETAGEKWDLIMDSYHRAIELAKDAANPKTIRDVYVSAISYLSGCPEGLQEKRVLESELDALYKAHPDLQTSEGESGEEEGDPLDSQDSVEQDLILSCSSSEDEEDSTLVSSRDVTSTRQLRGVALRKKSHLSKRNEKGETSLHVATIDGNFNRVKNLLDEGSAVDTRDHCGWTPLHEACNHGYTDIVSLLVEHGASVNDPGGVHCHQTTPLMDAAINGHVDIVQYLVSKGADLAKKNDKGNTALALINQSLSSNEGSSRYDLYQEHLDIREILLKEMKRKGLSCLSGASPNNDHVTSGHVTSSDGHTNLPVAVVRPLPSQCRESQDIPALLPDDDDIDCGNEWVESEGNPLPLHDNWLFDDMGWPPKKKRKKSMEPSITRPSSRTKPNRNVGVATNKRPDRQKGLLSRVNDVDMSDVEEGYWDIGDNCDIGDFGGNGCDIDNDMEVTNAFPTTSQPFASTTIRLNVRVDDVTYLVPCNRYHDNQPTTVATLIDKVCDRYLLQNGRRPVLSLTNSQGALLCPTDSVIDVVQEGEVLVGVVTHWDSLLLNEHYQTICSKFKTSPNKRLLKILESSANHLLLDLSNCGLRPVDSPALFQSLLPHTSITSLTVSGNDLGDSSAIHMSTLTRKLPNLYTLNMSCINLTSNGLLTFSQSLKTSLNGQSLPLRSLSISHNSLGPTSGSALSQILSVFPYLVLLDLTDIGITSYTLEGHTGLLDGIVSLKELHTLSLSLNNIGREGVALLIPMVSTMASLTSLNLRNTSTTAYTDLLAKTVLQMSSLIKIDLSGNDLGITDDFWESLSVSMHIQDLSLSVACLTLQSMHNMASYFRSCTQLHRVDLSGNSQLTNQGVMELISNCQPSELLLQSCGLQSPLPKQLYSRETRTYLNLSDNNGIALRDKEFIAEYWSKERTVMLGDIFILR